MRHYLEARIDHERKVTMKKRVSITLITSLLVLLVAIPASASNAIQVSATRRSISPPMNRKWWPVGDDKCFVRVDFVYEYEGTLTGTALTHLRVLSHGPCEENGPVPYKYYENLLLFGTFTGKVDGASGSFDFVEVAEVFPVDPPEVTLKGRMLIRSGAGELEGIRGFLNTTWVKGSPTELSGWIRL
jgi:hypothetical protein